MSGSMPDPLTPLVMVSISRTKSWWVVEPVALSTWCCQRSSPLVGGAQEGQPSSGEGCRPGQGACGPGEGLLGDRKQVQLRLLQGS